MKLRQAEKVWWTMIGRGCPYATKTRRRARKRMIKARNTFRKLTDPIWRLTMGMPQDERNRLISIAVRGRYGHMLVQRLQDTQRAEAGESK